MTVKFSSENELIDELRKEFPLKQDTKIGSFGQVPTIPTAPAGTILRLSGLLKTIPNLAPVRQLFVIATIKDTRGDILRLEHYCGDVWGLQPEDKKANDRAKEVENTIEKACQELGIEVRGGVFEA